MTNTKIIALFVLLGGCSLSHAPPEHVADAGIEVDARQPCDPPNPDFREHCYWRGVNDEIPLASLLGDADAGG